MKKKYLFFIFMFLILINIDIVSAEEYVKCGEITGIPAALPKFSRNIVNAVKFLVPVVLCILGMIDFAKATMSNDEKVMKESTNKFIKRIISAALIYFIVAIVQFIFNVLAEAGDQLNENDIKDCIQCFISDENGCLEDTETGNGGGKNG